MKRAISFLHDEEGLEITEFALMSALICLGISAVLVDLANAASTLFTRVANTIAMAIP
jgi:Flp pilus assembly pilin Flp